MGAKLASLSGVLGATQDRGLSFITSSSFSAASSVSVDGCFTVAYSNYRVMLSATHSAGVVGLTFRFRVGGVDDSSANYAYQYLDGTGAGASAARATGQTSLGIGVSSTGTWINLDIFDPFVASPTYAHLTSGVTVAAPVLTIYTLGHNVSSAFDGLSLTAASGTITGSLRIYGYRNA